MFYKLGSQRALEALGLFKSAAPPPPKQPAPAPPPRQPPAPPKRPPPIMGRGQAKTLRGEGVFI